MNMQNFIESLTPEQKAEFVKALQEDKEVSPLAVEDNKDIAPLTADKPKGSPRIEVGDDFVVRRVDANGNPSESRRRPVKGGANTWVDTGEDRNEDTVTPDFKPVTRSRPEATKVDKTCIACKKIVQVNPAIVYGEFYRCDKCGGSR